MTDEMSDSDMPDTQTQTQSTQGNSQDDGLDSNPYWGRLTPLKVHLQTVGDTGNCLDQEKQNILNYRKMVAVVGGWLYINFQSQQLNQIYSSCVDLLKDSFCLGRAPNCDVMLDSKNFEPNRLDIVSKTHFVISRENEVVYISDKSKNGTYINGQLIGKGNKWLLDNDDKIGIGSKAITIYVFNSYQKSENFLPKGLARNYVVGKRLGMGAGGEVQLAYNKFTCEPCAIKKIIKPASSSDAIANLRILNEVNILKSLNHPNIVRINGVIENQTDIFIILEYMAGGDLSDRIPTLDSEREVGYLFYQIALAVSYLHKNGVVHRDLKPANVLLNDRYTLVKVTDFGFSKIADEMTELRTVCGTPHFVAPEVLSSPNAPYTPQVDLWSLGIILFNMLSKKLPFSTIGKREVLFQAIILGKYSMDGPEWENVSLTAKDLVKRLLVTDPRLRLTINGVLQHPWLQASVIKIQKTLYQVAPMNPTKKKDSFSSSDESGNSISMPFKKFKPNSA